MGEEKLLHFLSCQANFFQMEPVEKSCTTPRLLSPMSLLFQNKETIAFSAVKYISAIHFHSLSQDRLLLLSGSSSFPVSRSLWWVPATPSSALLWSGNLITLPCHSCLHQEAPVVQTQTHVVQSTSTRYNQWLSHLRNAPSIVLGTDHNYAGSMEWHTVQGSFWKAQDRTAGVDWSRRPGLSKELLRRGRRKKLCI